MVLHKSDAKPPVWFMIWVRNYWSQNIFFIIRTIYAFYNLWFQSQNSSETKDFELNSLSRYQKIYDRRIFVTFLLHCIRLLWFSNLPTPCMLLRYSNYFASPYSMLIICVVQVDLCIGYVRNFEFVFNSPWRIKLFVQFLSLDNK